MKVAIFPEGGVHSAYLDVINNPPDGVEYVGDFSHASESLLDNKYVGIVRYVLDKAKLPYFAIPDVDKDVDLIHSSQKLLFTDKDYVVDIEHGNPFMGADAVNKYKYLQYKFTAKRMIMENNCKYILPWTNTARDAFKVSHSFLGDKFFEDKVKTVYPATKYIGKHHKTKKFTFTFVGGTTWDTFYSKGGIQILNAVDILDFAGYDYNINFISKNIPDEFNKVGDGLVMANGLPRDKLMDMFMNTDVLLLPSVCDTFGMVIIEAMARGIPSIVSDSFAAKEVVGNTGVVMGVDYNVEQWFDDDNLKIAGKGVFHDQFRYGEYYPHFEHVLDLATAMAGMMDNKGFVKYKSRECLKEVQSGRFSIDNRNKALKEVYE